MNTIAISDLRTKLPSVVEKISENLERLVVTVSGKQKAVLISIEELEALEETAEILAIPGAWESIKEGRDDIKRGKVTNFQELKKKNKDPRALSPGFSKVKFM